VRLPKIKIVKAQFAELKDLQESEPSE
jgi:hypothetical protein